MLRESSERIDSTDSIPVVHVLTSLFPVVCSLALSVFTGGATFHPFLSFSPRSPSCFLIPTLPTPTPLTARPLPRLRRFQFFYFHSENSRGSRNSQNFPKPSRTFSNLLESSRIFSNHPVTRFSSIHVRFRPTGF